MVSLVMTFHVRDYDSWRKNSDRFLRSGGGEGAIKQQIYRAVDDPDEVTVVIETRTREDAERIMRTREDLRSALDAAGIEVYPAAFLGEKVEEIVY
jgi:hypothetical protein